MRLPARARGFESHRFRQEEGQKIDTGQQLQAGDIYHQLAICIT